MLLDQAHACPGLYQCFSCWIGDAQGDLAAARQARVLFYPIDPGAEERAWERFCDEAYPRFLAGTYAGPYEQGLIAAFEALLPDTPPWLPKRL